jgi:diguanylate cyclase (GGDEF)-like protein
LSEPSRNQQDQNGDAPAPRFERGGPQPDPAWLTAPLLREAGAEERDMAALARDRRAAQRDQRAIEREAAFETLEAELARLEQPITHGAELLLRAASDRRRAAKYRLLVAELRAAAAQDRATAARDRAAAALDRDVSRRERELAGHDELTGALRRGVGLAALARELERAERAEQSLVVAYVDVDGLKAVNDSAGHAEGDALLLRVSAQIRARLRGYDLFIRMGGDEFVCAMVSVDPAEVRRRFALASHSIEAGSISVGFAERMDDDSVFDLVHRADADLMSVRAGQRG